MEYNTGNHIPTQNQYGGLGQRNISRLDEYGVQDLRATKSERGIPLTDGKKTGRFQYQEFNEEKDDDDTILGDDPVKITE